jgi:hypothetical protein
MFEVYFTDKVNPSACVHKCNTLKEAKKWISEQLKGYTMVDEGHPCSEDVFYSSATAYYEVYDGEPVAFNNDYEPNFKSPLFESGFFYTR